jgi:hypothetical protein
VGRRRTTTVPVRKLCDVKRSRSVPAATRPAMPVNAEMHMAWVMHSFLAQGIDSLLQVAWRIFLQFFRKADVQLDDTRVGSLAFEERLEL